MSETGIGTLLMPDPRMKGWSFHGLGGPSQPPASWSAAILEIALSERVPQDIRSLFDRAKTAAAYGRYAYELFILAMEEVQRVKDAALLVACEKQGAPKNATGTYQKRISWAVKNGLIGPDAEVRWEAGRWLRNHGSHKVQPNLLGPNDALNMFGTAKILIDALYEPSA